MSNTEMLIRILLFAIIPIILGAVFFIVQKTNDEEIIKNLTEEHIVLRLPRVYLWVGCFITAFWFAIIGLMMWFPNETAVRWVYMVFILFAFLGVALIWGTIIWKIEIFRSEEFFLYRTPFGKTYKVFYSDCASYRYSRANTLILKTKERTFYIDIFSTNFEFLLLMLSQNEIPEIE